MPLTEPAAPEIVMPDKRTKWSQQTWDRAAAMWQAGFSARNIADLLRVSRNAVLGKMHRMGLQRLPSRQSATIKKSNSAGVAVQRHARQTAVAVQAPAAAEPPMPFLGLALVELEAHHCRYPQGNEFFKFCGQPRRNGSPYCPHHHRLCFVRGSAR